MSNVSFDLPANVRKAHGIDISKYQMAFTIKNYTETPRPVDFIIQRSSYGGKIDEKFADLYEMIKPHKNKGTYHYYNSGVTWQTQADLFLTNTDGLGYRFYAVDYEKAYNNLNSFTYSDLMSIMEWLEARVPNVLLYCNQDVWNSLLEPYGQAHRTKPFWYAKYLYFPSTDKVATLPKNCAGYLFWQYEVAGSYYSTSDGRHYGSMYRPLDLNVSSMSVTEFENWLGTEEAPVNPLVKMTEELMALNQQSYQKAVEINNYAKQ